MTPRGHQQSSIPAVRPSGSITAWRIIDGRHLGDDPHTAFSGEGARLYGGRWNSRGTAVAYVASSRALALLEVLVHLASTRALLRYVLVPITFEASAVEELPESALPEGWRAHPAPPATQAVGDAWVLEERSAVLRVPSVLVPAEVNYLVNPRHPAFEMLEVEAPEAFVPDDRLLAFRP